jgi:predicted DNA-binding transcriptional regulator YafY
VPEVQGVAYVLARCHLSNAERTFRLDRIRECWLDEDGMSRVREGREASEA